MLHTIECAGHPRDMGEAQGEALRSAIRREAARLELPTRRSRRLHLRPLVVGAVRGAGAGREMLRHFAHLSERIEGLAQAADLPFDTVLALHLRVRAGGEAGGLLSRRARLRASARADASGDKRPMLERSLPAPIGDECGWVLRESRPAVGFRSLEVTLPWLVSSVAGVNAGGLAVVAGPLLWGRPGAEGLPSSLLLVQEGLHRFEDHEGALGWCGKRPVEGEQSIVLGDASGAIATVVLTGRARRVQRGEGELQLEGGETPPPPPSQGDASPIDPETSDRVRIDARGRRLRLELDGVELEAGFAQASIRAGGRAA